VDRAQSEFTGSLRRASAGLLRVRTYARALDEIEAIGSPRVANDGRFPGDSTGPGTTHQGLHAGKMVNRGKGLPSARRWPSESRTRHAGGGRRWGESGSETASSRDGAPGWPSCGTDGCTAGPATGGVLRQAEAIVATASTSGSPDTRRRRYGHADPGVWAGNYTNHPPQVAHRGRIASTLRCRPRDKRPNHTVANWPALQLPEADCLSLPMHWDLAR